MDQGGYQQTEMARSEAWFGVILGLLGLPFGAVWSFLFFLAFVISFLGG
jgi:hypothetical protein